MQTRPWYLVHMEYENYAEEYLRNLPPSHFMESTSQARQREITLESLALVTAQRPNVRVFNELLVQYPYSNRRRPHQVVPDNMVVLSDAPIKARGSYNTPLQPAPVFWVMEYVSRENKRKDYEDSYLKYERELKVPYYLLFYPDEQELTLFHLGRQRYASVPPNAHGRYPLPELELEVALLDEWTRFWYRGELLPLPADLQRQLDTLRQLLEAEKRRADEEQQRAEREKQARLAAEQELEQLRQQLQVLRKRTGEA